MSDASLDVRSPFLMRVRYPAQEGLALFRVSRLFDFHEIVEDGHKREPALVVDPLLVEPTTAELRFTPTEPLQYAEIQREVEWMLERMAPELGAAPTIVSIEWDHGTHGIHSRGKARVRRI